MPNVTNYTTTGTELTSIADAIREKTGDQGLLTYPDGFVDAIGDISGGGGGGGDCTACLGGVK